MTFNENQFRWAAVFAVVLLGFVAYAGSLSGEFVWDDASSILLHEHVKDPSKAVQLFREDQHVFGRGEGNFYRPLLSLSFMVDYFFAHTPENLEIPPAFRPPEVGPFLFHITSTLWHIAAALLLFALMTRLGATATVRLLVVLVYVLHPLHTEAVAYISGRADSMAAAFMFAGLTLSVGDPRSPRRGLSIIFASWCFIFGLLSKEAAIIYPALLFLCLFFGARNRDAENAPSLSARLLPLYYAVPIAGAYAALRATVLNFAPMTGSRLSFSESAQTLATYVGLIFAPLNLHMEWSLAHATGLTAAAGFVLLAAAIALMVYGHRCEKPGVTLGMGWFLVGWLVISGALLPLNAPMAEHWMYVPLAGFLWALATLLFDGPFPKPVGRALATVTAIWCVWLLSLTTTRNADWHDNETLYTTTLRENPGSIRVRYNLAVTYQDLLGNPIGARREYQLLLSFIDAMNELDPAAAVPWNSTVIDSRMSLARIAERQGNFAESANQYMQVIQRSQAESRKQYLTEALLSLGRVRLAMGDEMGADQSFLTLLQSQPELVEPILRLKSEGTRIEEF